MRAPEKWEDWWNRAFSPTLGGSLRGPIRLSLFLCNVLHVGDTLVWFLAHKHPPSLKLSPSAPEWAVGGHVYMKWPSITPRLTVTKWSVLDTYPRVSQVLRNQKTDQSYTDVHINESGNASCYNKYLLIDLWVYITEIHYSVKSQGSGSPCSSEFKPGSLWSHSVQTTDKWGEKEKLHGRF